MSTQEPGWAYNWTSPMPQDFDWENAFNIFAASKPLTTVAVHFYRAKEHPNSSHNDYNFRNGTDLRAHKGVYRGFDRRAILVGLGRSRLVSEYFKKEDWTTIKKADVPPDNIIREAETDKDVINFIVRKTYDE